MISSNNQALDLIVKAIKKSGFVNGKDVSICLDVAANELFKKNKYSIHSKNYISVEKSIKVLKKAPGFPSDHSICQQGPIASKVNLGFNAYKSHIDNNGNLYVVGSNYSNTGGDYSGSMNWFVEKFSEDGTQIWKKEQSVLNYPPYYDFHSTSINTNDKPFEYGWVIVSIL